MDDISNILNFDINENHPIDSVKVNENNILNRSAEQSVADSVAFLQSSLLAEKQILTSFDNSKIEEPHYSFAIAGDSNGFATINSEENINLSSEDLIGMAESTNSSLMNETSTSIKTNYNTSIKSAQNDSGCEIDSCPRSTYPCLDKISAGSVDILQDTLSDEKQKSLTNSIDDEISSLENIDSKSACVTKSNLEKNNVCMITPNLVDFSFRGQVTDDLVGSFAGIDSLSPQPEPYPNGSLEEICDINSAVKFEENKPVNTSAELLENECVSKVPNSPETNKQNESTLEANDIVPKDSINCNSLLGMSENPENEVGYVSAIANTSVEFKKPIIDEVSIIGSCKLNALTEYKDVNSDEAAIQMSENASNKPAEISPSKEKNIFFELSDKPLENLDISTDNECKVGSDKAAFQVSENMFNDITDVASPWQIERISFGMSDTPFIKSADPDFAFKIPEVKSINPLEQFSDMDSASQIPEVPSNNPLEKINEPDFAFKVPEVPSFRNSVFSPKIEENSLTNEGNEQFVDAAQFFKDADSIQFLENIRTSTIQSGSPIARSSLYVNFDPLHLKFQNNLNPDNCASTTAAVQEKDTPVESSENQNSEVVKKHLDVAVHESMGNILISFDSPKSLPIIDSKMVAHTPASPKMLTEEEHQQKLKIHELETQEAYLKKQKEMEMLIAERDELLKVQLMVMQELSGTSGKLFEEIRKGNEKIISLEAENKKLKEDLKTSSEDLQSVENTFTDFYKRYEQCKGMLKSFKDNEENLKQKILCLQAEAKEQEHMYSMLKERTEEMLEKANVELDNAKRSGEAQLTVLKAQLKKAEMKISSLESDNKQIKIENSQLGGICDDLMAKVSRS